MLVKTVVDAIQKNIESTSIETTIYGPSCIRISNDLLRQFIECIEETTQAKEGLYASSIGSAEIARICLLLNGPTDPCDCEVWIKPFGMYRWLQRAFSSGYTKARVVWHACDSIGRLRADLFGFPLNAESVSCTFNAKQERGDARVLCLLLTRSDFDPSTHNEEIVAYSDGYSTFGTRGGLHNSVVLQNVSLVIPIGAAIPK